MKNGLVAVFFFLMVTLRLGAQEVAWVQVEAQPSLSQAQDRVRAYATLFDNVNGYSLGSRWYAIVLGPYGKTDAETLMVTLKRQGLIPGDSFIADGSDFRQQFWPIGVGANVTAQPLPQGIAPLAPPPAPDAETAPETAPEIAETIVPPEVTPEPVPAITPPTPDETVAQARETEDALSRTDKQRLQTALEWAGVYDGAIDGLFGRGTRASMAAWQTANNHEPTGVLTTAQRAELIGAYNAILNGLDLQIVRDDAAGIELAIPTGIVAFAAYDPPFARYDATDGSVAQVLLISQAGDQNRLFGLYEILQTLEIVPPDGPRTREDTSFELEGVNGTIHSYTYAELQDGQIKGFTLVWPAGDDARRTRLLGEMRASFASVPGILDPGIATPGEGQAIDLVSGLSVRKPTLSRSGFYIDTTGRVLTTSEAVASCDYITLDNSHPATVTFTDAALGIAVLTPSDTLAPIGVAAFQTGVPRLQSEVAVGGFPYGGVLTMPSLTFGRLADIRGLNGEDAVKRLSLVAQPGDAGGPVFDNGGAVLGMLLPKVATNGQVLPPEVSFSVDADAIVQSLTGAGVAVQTTTTQAYMPPETMTLLAADMTVLVSCW